MKVCLDRLTYLQILSDIKVYRDWQTDGNLYTTCLFGQFYPKQLICLASETGLCGHIRLYVCTVVLLLAYLKYLNKKENHIQSYNMTSTLTCI